MTTESAAVSPARSRPAPVLVLGVLGVLTFVLIPIRINTIYSGLPAHPLFLHVPVILIPVVGIAALGLAARPAAATIALRAAMAVLAVLCLYFVFHTGDLGAKAVWQGRVHTGGGFGGPPGGGGVGSLFPGGGGGGDG